MSVQRGINMSLYESSDEYEVLIIVCENTLEGVFSGIYFAYEQKKSPKEIRLLVGEPKELLLFSRILYATPDALKAQKVIRTICDKFGMNTYYQFCQALATMDEERADAVYHAIVVGLSMKSPMQLMNHLANDWVHKVFCLSRAVNNEILHMKGFLRFQELEGGILFSKIGPKHDIVEFIMPHFSDRFQNQNFMIYDETRNRLAIHPANQEWAFADSDVQNIPSDDEISKHYVEGELEYQKLFQHFCDTIAIRERKNLFLQRQMLPLRFRKNMTEF